MHWWLGVHAITVLFYAGFGIFVHRRRPPPALWPALPLAVWSAFLWVAGDLFAVLAPDPSWEWIAILVLYTGSIPLPALLWLAALRLAEVHGAPFGWGRRWYVWIPLAVAGALWVALVTSPWHGRYVTPVVGGRQEHHVLWWLSAGIAQLDLIATCGLFWVLRRRPSPPALRRQASVLLVALSADVLANLVVPFLPSLWPVDLNVGASFVCGVVLLGGIVRTRLFDLSPLALSEIVHTDPSAVLITDDRGRLRFANRSARALLPQLDVRPDAPVLDALGEMFVLVEAEDDASLLTGALRTWVLEAGPEGRAGLLRNEAGSSDRARWLWIRTAPAATRAHEGRLHHLRLQDASQLVALAEARRKLLERLDRAERLEQLGTFAGSLAHELRSPLAAIVARAQLAASEHAGDAALDASLAEIARQAKRSDEVIRSALRLARGEPPPRWSADLNDAVRAACEPLARRAEQRGVTLELALAPAPVAVWANPFEVERVVANLVRNATDSGATRVRVTTGRRAREALLCVRDDGRGIRPADRARLFEPLFTRGDAGGTGLGLSVASAIVRAHAGSIDVESAPAVGTEVRVRMPAGPPAEDAVRSESAPDPAP